MQEMEAYKQVDVMTASDGGEGIVVAVVVAAAAWVLLLPMLGLLTVLAWWPVIRLVELIY
jgi:hypothetical protein